MTATVGASATELTATKASGSPAPTAVGPKAPTGRPLASSAARIWAWPAPGLACRIRAAIAAACGAAAEVPQKRQALPDLKAKKVVMPQSVATRSGLLITTSPVAAAGVAPATGPKRWTNGPREE